MLQDLVSFIQNNVFTLSLVLTGSLYCWVIFNAVRSRLFISAGTSTVLFILFVTNHYTSWIFELLDNIPYFLGLAIIIFMFPVLPTLVHKWEEKRQ
jgi:apolipoprotein N-acyltransferase